MEDESDPGRVLFQLCPGPCERLGKIHRPLFGVVSVDQFSPPALAFWGELDDVREGFVVLDPQCSGEESRDDLLPIIGDNIRNAFFSPVSRGLEGSHFRGPM
jgi:hypothetical protein